MNRVFYARVPFYVAAYLPGDRQIAHGVQSISWEVRWIGAPFVEQLGVVEAGHGNH